MQTKGSCPRIACAVLSILLLLTTLHGVARAERKRLDFSGFIGLRTFAADSELGAENPNDVKIQNSAIFGVRAHYLIAPLFLAEGEFPLLISKTTETAADLHVLFIHPRVQVTFDPMPDNLWQPLAFAGLGLASSDFVAESEVVPQAHIGVGARFLQRMQWTARLDARWIIGPARDAGVVSEFELLLSVYRPEPGSQGLLGQRRGGDRDGDGVLDTDDQCPEEPEDRDFYYDKDGCPDPDNDRDQVLDTDDQCPRQRETRNDYKDEDGCPDRVPTEIQAFTGTIEGITFETDSANLRSSSFPVLDRAVEVLKGFPDLTVTIVGHTDDVGTHEYNLDLSQRRAEAVRTYLISKGIEEQRLKALGKGKTEPVDYNGTEEGRAKNRRVEFLLE